jgi:hypothetical protein
MAPFDLDVILWPVLTIFIGTLAVSLKVTKSLALSVSAALVKAGIFAVYFGFLFNGTYTFFDDWSYLEGGRELFLKGIGITNLAENWEFALMIGRGDHFVYYLYNTYAFRIFGEGYYAPVALNIFLTIFIAYFGTRLAIFEFSMNKQISRWFYLFLLLHPDILAWSNIMNGKDILVLLLHVIALISISLYWRGQHYKAMSLALPVVLTLLFLRFYVPIIFVVSLILGILLSGRRARFGYLIFLTSFTVLLISWIGESGFQYVLGSMQENLVNPVYGFIRALLTPIPFNTADNYAFLDFPALLHWMLIPFVPFGLLYIWRIKTNFGRFFISYFCVFAGLYAIYGELQGPRHRVQLDYAWAVLQYIGIMAAFGLMKIKNVTSRAMVAI